MVVRGARAGYNALKWAKRAGQVYYGAKRAYKVGRGVKRGFDAVRASMPRGGGGARPVKKPRTQSLWREKPQKSNVGTQSKPIVESTAFPEKAVIHRLNYKKNKLGRHLKMIGNKSFYEQLDPIETLGVAGLQTPTNISNSMIGTDIQTLYAAAAKQYNITAGSVIALPSNQTNYKCNRFYLHKLELLLKLTNQSPSPVEIDVYLLIAKKSGTGVPVPLTVWSTDNDNIEQAGTVDFTYPYARPNGKVWKGFYYTNKKYTVVMGPGCTHDFKFYHNINRVVDMDFVASNAWIKGISSQIMLVQRGSVADSAADNTIGGDVALTKTKVIGLLSRKFTTQMMSFFPRTHTQVSNMPAVPAALYQQNETEVVEDVQASANFA